MTDTTDARARLHTAERLERGPSAMDAGEQIAAHTAYGTTDLTPEQAYALARDLPNGVELPTGRMRHIYGIDSDGEPCTLLGIQAGPVWLLVWTYTAGHSPQVEMFVGEEDYAEHFDRAAKILRDNIHRAKGPYAESLRTFYGIVAPNVRPAGWLRQAHDMG